MAFGSQVGRTAAEEKAFYSLTESKQQKRAPAMRLIPFPFRQRFSCLMKGHAEAPVSEPSRSLCAYIILWLQPKRSEGFTAIGFSVPQVCPQFLLRSEILIERQTTEKKMVPMKAETESMKPKDPFVHSDKAQSSHNGALNGQVG